MVRVLRSLLLVLALIFIIACQPAIVHVDNITKTECKPPYYEYNPGDCCLDSEPNQICDRYENKTIVPPKNITLGPQAPQKSIVSDLLIKYRQNVSGYSVFRGKVQYIEHGNLIRVVLDKVTRLDKKINNTIDVIITDVYIDRQTREATGYCDPRHERDIMGNLDYDRSSCATLINIPITLPYDEYNPVLPEDWLTRFSHAEPELVETTDRYVKETTGWKAVNPVLHFNENGVAYVLSCETKTGLPVRIDIQEGLKKDVVDYNSLNQNSVKAQDAFYQPYQG